MGRRSAAAVIEESRVRLEYPRLLELVSRHATSRPGRAALRELTPLGDVDAIRQLLAETEEMRALVRRQGLLRLDVLIDARQLLASDGVLADRPFTGDELHGFSRLLDRNLSVGERLRQLEESPRLQARGESMHDPPELRERMAASIGARGEVLDAASSELGAIRQGIERQQRELRAWMERRRQLRELRGALQGDVISVRNDRYVFAVRSEHRHKVRGLVHAESTTGATLDIEPEEIVRRGNELATLKQRERHEVSRILAELTREVRTLRQPLLEIYRHLLEIDMALGRARFADTIGAVAPEIVTERRLELRHARHPLLLFREGQGEASAPGGVAPFDLERARGAVVATDLELGHGYHQLVITGPNTGGKTVVLKLVGLLALLAYSGIPIPAAEGSVMPVFDAILADIGDEQSLEQNLSTFSSHMSVTAAILARVSSRSLVLLDELGAGTDPLEGAALGEAILERLYERGAFTLVTTHLGRLKEFGFRRKKCRNASMEFDPEALAPTYRLRVGVPGGSNATIIARRIGIPQDVVDQADRIQAGEDRLDEEVIAGMERTRRDLERRRGEAEQHRRSARELEASAAREVEQLKSLRGAIEHEAERSEERRVQRLVDDIRRALKAMGEPPKERREAYDELNGLLDAALDGTTLGERRRTLAQSLKKGDRVFVPRLRAICEVKKINKTKELLTVSLAGIPTELGFRDLSWVLPPPGYELEWYDEGSEVGGERAREFEGAVSRSVPELTVRQARRLALARAGLLATAWSGVPNRAHGRGVRAQRACRAHVQRFGYLQLDSVSVAGARSHAIVLMSRLAGLDPALGEELLAPGAPYFEYWGHEASWLPLELYPLFDFRRRAFREHPWWGDIIGSHGDLARDLVRRIRAEGPLRAVDLGDPSGAGWWQLGPAKKVVSALWSSGELAIRERRGFLRSYDLTERVIPAELRRRRVARPRALEALIVLALGGHGWAERSTIAATWRLRRMTVEVEAALERLEERGEVLRCDLLEEAGSGSRCRRGWIRPEDLEAAARLERLRPRRDRGVLLSPFDPLLWDRTRVRRLFGFDQVLEVFKPAAQRKYGYYCLPVLAGEELVARYDLKADRARGRLQIRAEHRERKSSDVGAACRTALERYSEALQLAIVR